MLEYIHMLSNTGMKQENTDQSKTVETPQPLRLTNPLTMNRIKYKKNRFYYKKL
jgi:hypothetical protein